jgi:hypothetical protein
MVFYFIWYPIKTFKNKVDLEIGGVEMKADSELEFNTKDILSTAQVFNKSLQFIGLHFKLIIGFCLGITFLFLALDFVIQNNEYFKQYKVFTLDIETLLAQFMALNFTELYQVLGNIGVLLNTNNSLVLYALNSILMGCILLFSFHIFHSHFKQLERNKLASLVYAFVLSFGLNLAFLQNYFILQILIVFISPILLGFYVDQALKIKKISIMEKLKLLFGNSNKRISGLALILFIQLLLGTFFIVSPFSSLSISFVQLNFNVSGELNEFISKYLIAFLMVFMLSISLVMFFLQSMFLNFTFNEILSANEITEGIENIGKNKKVYGIETE